jgi:hypothetical protein
MEGIRTCTHDKNGIRPLSKEHQRETRNRMDGLTGKVSQDVTCVH